MQVSEITLKLNSNLGKKDTDPKETVVRQGAKPYASFMDQSLLCFLMDPKNESSHLHRKFMYGSLTQNKMAYNKSMANPRTKYLQATQHGCRHTAQNVHST
jgi:hypothetical protein